MVRKSLFLIVACCGLAKADTGYPTTIRVTETDNAPACTVGQLKVSPNTLTCNGQSATITTGGGGGGSSSLEVFSGPIQSSPTPSINLDPNAFTSYIHGTTYYFTLNPATTNFIQNKATLQSGATAYPDFVYVGTSGTVFGPYRVKGKFDVGNDDTGFSPTTNAKLEFDTSTNPLLLIKANNNTASGSAIDWKDSSDNLYAEISAPPSGGALTITQPRGFSSTFGITTSTFTATSFNTTPTSATVTGAGGLNTTYSITAGSYTAGGLTTCGDATHALGYNASSQFTCQSVTGSGGSGASSLAVTTGTASNYANPAISSPTAVISLLQTQFKETAAGTTAYVTLNASSVTLQGNTSVALLNTTQTWTAGQTFVSSMTTNALVLHTSGTVIPTFSQNFGRSTLNQWFTSMASIQSNQAPTSQNKLSFMIIGDSHFAKNTIGLSFTDYLYSNFGNAGTWATLSNENGLPQSDRPNGCSYSATGGWSSLSQQAAALGLDDDGMHTTTVGDTLVETCPGSDSVILHYVKQPNGGTIDFSVDGANHAIFSTANGVVAVASVTIANLVYGIHTASVSYTVSGTAGADVLDYMFYSSSTPGAVMYRFGDYAMTAAGYLAQDATKYQNLLNMLPSTPTVIMAEFGVNEERAGTDPLTYIANVRSLVQRFRNVYPQIDCAYMAPPSFAGDGYYIYPLTTYEANLLRASVEDQCAFVDFTAYFSTEPVFDKYYVDALHLNAQGGQVGAQLLINTFGNNLANITPFTYNASSNVVAYGNDQSTTAISNVTTFGYDISVTSGITNSGAVGNNLALTKSNTFLIGGAAGSGNEQNVQMATGTLSSLVVNGGGGVVVNTNVTAASMTLTSPSNLAVTAPLLQLNVNNPVAASNSVGGAINVNMTSSTGTAVTLYSNQGTNQQGNMLNIRVDNPAFNQNGMFMDYKGATAAVTIRSSVTTTGYAFNIIGQSTHTSTMQLAGNEADVGTFKITHTSPTLVANQSDANASVLSLSLAGAGTQAQGLFIDAPSGTSGKLLNLRNQSVEQLTLAGDGTLTNKYGITAGSMTVSNLASGQCVQTGTGGLLTVTGSVCGGAGATPGLPFNSVQYNNAGAFGGSANFNWSGSSLTVIGDGTALINAGATLGTILTLSTATVGTPIVSVSTVPAVLPSDYELTLTSAATSVMVVGFQADGHFVSSGTVPTLTACGSSPSVDGTDLAGVITVGAGVVTSCTLNFANAFGRAPICLVQDNSTTVSASLGTITSTSAIFNTSATLGGGLLYYLCVGNKG